GGCEALGGLRWPSVPGGLGGSREPGGFGGPDCVDCAGGVPAGGGEALSTSGIRTIGVARFEGRVFAGCVHLPLLGESVQDSEGEPPAFGRARTGVAAAHEAAPAHYGGGDHDVG